MNESEEDDTKRAESTAELARNAMKSALRSPNINPGDTFTISVPSVQLTDPGVKLFMGYLQDVAAELHFAVGYTFGARSITLTRSNMPGSTTTDSSVQPVGSLDDNDVLSDLFELVFLAVRNRDNLSLSDILMFLNLMVSLLLAVESMKH